MAGDQWRSLEHRYEYLCRIDVVGVLMYYIMLCYCSHRTSLRRHWRMPKRHKPQIVDRVQYDTTIVVW